MILLLEFASSYCCTTNFMINGVSGEPDDFGEKYDRDSDSAMAHGCGDMEFTRVAPTPEVLEKYSINEKQYQEVCEKLEEGLSFGDCGLCI